MNSLIKGQATKLAASTLQIIAECGLVAVPSKDGSATLKPVSLYDNTEWCTAGRIDLEKLLSSSDKIKLIANEPKPVKVESGSFSTILHPSSSDKFWALAELYLHNGGWKLRFIDEPLADESAAAKWVSAPQSVVTELLNYTKSFGADVTSSASQLFNSQNQNEFANNAKQTASAIKNTGLSLFNKLRGRATSEVKKFKGKTLLDASMAAAALVAYADGYASPDEEKKLIDFVRTTDELSSYDIEEVKSSYNAIVNQLRTDKIIGQGKAIALVEKLSGKDESPVIIALAISVANTENGIDDDEKVAIRKIINVLNSDISLYEEYL